MTTETLIKSAIDEIAPRFSIQKVYLFGSYARNEQTESSDIDLAIETGDSFSLFDAARFNRQISEALQSTVDVISRRTAVGSFGESIAKDEVLLYEQSQ